MNVLRDMECSTCLGVFEMFQEMNTPKSFVGVCPMCNNTGTLDRIYLTAPGIAFGMISGAVGGSGFYATDHKNSDLIKGRAIEHKNKMHGE